MHVGFIVREITEKEINHKCIYIPKKDREIFPNSNVLFFVDSYEETYGAYINNDGFLVGIENWFAEYPHSGGDIVIISRNAEGYSLSSTSELVQQQIEETFEQIRMDELDSEAELCPNCQYALEKTGTKGDRYILKCARCGFTLVRKIPIG